MAELENLTFTGDTVFYIAPEKSVGNGGWYNYSGSVTYTPVATQSVPNPSPVTVTVWERSAHYVEPADGWNYGDEISFSGERYLIYLAGNWLVTADAAKVKALPDVSAGWTVVEEVQPGCRGVAVPYCPGKEGDFGMLIPTGSGDVFHSLSNQFANSNTLRLFLDSLAAAQWEYYPLRRLLSVLNTRATVTMTISCSTEYSAESVGGETGASWGAVNPNFRSGVPTVEDLENAEGNTIEVGRYETISTSTVGYRTQHSVTNEVLELSYAVLNAQRCLTELCNVKIDNSGVTGGASFFSKEEGKSTLESKLYALWTPDGQGGEPNPGGGHWEFQSATASVHYDDRVYDTPELTASAFVIDSLWTGNEKSHIPGELEWTCVSASGDEYEGGVDENDNVVWVYVRHIDDAKGLEGGPPEAHFDSSTGTVTISYGVQSLSGSPSDSSDSPYTFTFLGVSVTVVYVPNPIPPPDPSGGGADPVAFICRETKFNETVVTDGPNVTASGSSGDVVSRRARVFFAEGRDSDDEHRKIVLSANGGMSYHGQLNANSASATTVTTTTKTYDGYRSRSNPLAAWTYSKAAPDGSEMTDAKWGVDYVTTTNNPAEDFPIQNMEASSAASFSTGLVRALIEAILTGVTFSGSISETNHTASCSGGYTEVSADPGAEGTQVSWSKSGSKYTRTATEPNLPTDSYTSVSGDDPDQISPDANDAPRDKDVEGAFWTTSRKRTTSSAQFVVHVRDYTGAQEE